MQITEGGRRRVAYVVLLDNQVKPSQKNSSVSSSRSSCTRGLRREYPFWTPDAEVTTIAADRDSAVTALRAHQKRAMERHTQQTVARLRRQPSGTCCERR